MTTEAPADHLIIRSARRSDAGRLAELLSFGSLHPGAEDLEDPSPYAEAIDRIDSEGGGVLVAELDGVVVGVVVLLVFTHLHNRGGRCAELESMHVHPELRGHGIGGRLLEAVVAEAASKGCYRVQLTSNVARPDAHRFYEAHGFEASHLGFKRALDA